MKTVYLVDGKYFDFEANKPTIGGIQTYITDLLEVIKELGYKVILYVNDPLLRSVKYNDVFIRSYYFEEDNNKWEKVGLKVYSEMENKDSLVIYYSDEYVPLKTKFSNIIAIQHGIFWDKPSPQRNILRMMMSKLKFTYNVIRRMRMVTDIVCVDYNFINWYRTQVDSVENNLIAIPNYTRILPKIAKPDDKLNIVFARRMFWYRGTRVFTEAVISILNKYPDVLVTIAGEGPDEPYMREALSCFKNVTFTSFLAEDSLNFHSDKHIAVVPTVGSEGTSLSLLEAMSSQCAVIASNVGGMTNIILDGYNGLLVEAGNSEQLYLAIEKLILDEELRNKLSDNAYETAKIAFSYERWALKWKELLTNRAV